MKNTLYLLAALLGLSSPIHAQSMNPYDKCTIALSNGDMESVVTQASIIRDKVNVSFANVEKGEKCLEAAFGGNYAYSSKTLRWVSGAAATETEKALKLRQAKATIETELRCLTKKNEAIESIYQGLEAVVRASNNSVIKELTLKACERLHSKNPDAAILDPICQEAFKVSLHPELVLDKETDLFSRLSEERLKVESRKAVLKLKQKELTGTKSNPLASGGQASLTEVAFQSCD